MTAGNRLRSFALLQARLLRRRWRRGVQAVRCRRLSLTGAPVFFANSFPKSGTHLLTQVMEGFTRLGPAVDSGLPAVVMYQGDSGRPRSQADILADLRRLLPGDIAYGHVHAFPEAQEALCRPGMATYFILRDPRDVVVSHVHYVTDMAPAHAHHAYYQSLPDFNARLSASILGLPQLDVPFPDIGRRFEPFLGWMERPEVLCLHYEDFLDERQAALGRVLDHAIAHGFEIHLDRPHAIQVLEESINPQRSPTFRSGKSGGWKQHFTDLHRQQFKQVAGEMLICLGYEKGETW
jgi:hypothetical protein